MKITQYFSSLDWKCVRAKFMQLRMVLILLGKTCSALGHFPVRFSAQFLIFVALVGSCYVSFLGFYQDLLFEILVHYATHKLIHWLHSYLIYYPEAQYNFYFLICLQIVNSYCCYIVFSYLQCRLSNNIKKKGYFLLHAQTCY